MLVTSVTDDIQQSVTIFECDGCDANPDAIERAAIQVTSVPNRFNNPERNNSMHNTESNLSAILRGEQRSRRFPCRHTLAGAANELGIPTGWTWFWYHDNRLRSQTWLRRIWVRLEDVKALFSDLKAVYDAFYATGEPVSAPRAVREVLTRWPEFPKEMYIPEVRKKPAASVISFPAAKEEAR
jgi:hypothetical protein